MPTTTRIAWWAFFAVPLGLLIVLLVARPVAALPLPTGPLADPAISLPPDEEEDEGDETEDEGEEEELEEDEEEDGEDDFPPSDCLLRTARARVFAYPAQNRVRLLIHYTAAEPTDATVAYRLAGAKGPLRFADGGQHLGKAGSIRLSRNLSAGQTSKVSAATSFTVEIRIPDTPRSCRSFDTRHLTIEHGGGRRLTWLQSESALGA
jgi:hypothetical protein